jgi:pimeloyl-ACP methyl ester carboxylesterase
VVRVPVIRVRDVDVYYDIHECRPSDARPVLPPVLLLHGLGSSGRDWPLQIPAFATCAPVIAVDLRGHGRSSRGRGRPTVERMADDVVGVLQAVAQAPVHVVGLSLGGCVGLALAIRAPGRVRSLTLVNAFASRPRLGWRGLGRLLKRLGLLGTAPMRLVAAHVARDMFPRPEQDEIYRAVVESLSRNTKAAYTAALLALIRFDARGGLGQVRCPTLIVAGERDVTVPLAAKRRLGHAIASARFLLVPDSGHATNIDQAEIFNRAVLEFIGQH